MPTILVATGSAVLRCDDTRSTMTPATGLADQRPTCLYADAGVPGRAWCGTHRGGVFRSDDAGSAGASRQHCVRAADAVTIGERPHLNALRMGQHVCAVTGKLSCAVGDRLHHVGRAGGSRQQNEYEARCCAADRRAAG